MMLEQNLSNINEKLDVIENYLLNYDDYTQDETKEIKHNCRRLRSEFKSRWTEAHNDVNRFMKNNKVWLDS